MIERVVLVKLKADYTDPERRREVALHSHEALAAVPGVREVAVGTPADPRAAESWDLAIRVRLDSLEDVATYAADPGHRAYVDNYLKPRMEVIKAWNGEISPSLVRSTGWSSILMP